MAKELKFLDWINSLVEDYFNGFLTERDYLDMAYRVFQDAYMVFRDKYALEKHRWSEEDMADFEEGYEAWLDGEVTEKFGRGCEFFEFVKAIDIPYSALEPLPAGIMWPRRSMSFIPKSDNGLEYVWHLFYLCIDDDGMFEDEDPVGNTYVLTDDMDLEAVLTVKSVKTTDDLAFIDPRNKVPRTNKHEIKYMTEFACTGYFEGYTAKRRKSSAKAEEPYIYVYYHEDYSSSGGVYSISIYPSDEDEAAIRNCPLWHDYFDWLDTKNWTIRNAFKRYKDRMGAR